MRHDLIEILCLYFENYENNYYEKISYLTSKQETIIFLKKYGYSCTLKNFINLTQLALIDNKIDDLIPLKNLVNLTQLALIDNKIEDLIPLENLVNLTHLHLDKNKIKDITPLKKLVKLEYLGLSDNQIKDINPLKKLRKLKAFYFYSYHTNNIALLK